MTRASDQQKKQRQKEFRERKEHQEMLKAMAKKAKRDAAGNEEANDKSPKTEE